MIYTEEQWLVWIDQLAENDYVVIDNFFPVEFYARISEFFQHKREENSFAKAGIGSLNNQKISEIRGDFTYWLDKEIDNELDFWFDWMQTLKNLLNRYCYLSLTGDEFHLAHYPKGSFYKKHLDQFHERNNRMITVLLYLKEYFQEKVLDCSGQEYDLFDLLTKKDLGDLIGATRQTIANTLRKVY